MTDPARREPDDHDEHDGVSDATGPTGQAPTPWFGDQYDVGGLGMGRLFAWAAVLLGAGALGIALFAPLEGQALRTVWIAGFGAAAMWVAWMAPARYRRAGVRVSWAVPLATVLGALAIGVAIYAFIVIVAASGGVELPAPSYWLGPTAPAPGVPT
ncbi:hypothetical protein [Agromyces binzhouensis]|uniref:Uncharacterized protein n=1 Tax=Agromyces binzhouensis TaxID=1817495 RepID=A0A4Q2JYP1_9MICO|nr:hypothetical protein [Agromyces binzhouensis]RXZ51388.1 hypothetical protein ESO86_02845 [Agromyces binzhouensis]